MCNLGLRVAEGLETTTIMTENMIEGKHGPGAVPETLYSYPQRGGRGS